MWTALAAVAVSVLAVLGPEALAARPAAPAGKVDVLLSPAAVTAGVGQQFTLEIVIEPGTGAQVDGATATASYDSRYLRALQITPGETLNVPLGRSIDNDQGRIDYSAGRLDGQLPSSRFVLAQVAFEIKAALPGAVRIDLQRGDSLTQVTSRGVDLVASVGSTSVQMTSSPQPLPATPAPTVAPYVPPPAPTAVPYVPPAATATSSGLPGGAAPSASTPVVGGSPPPSAPAAPAAPTVPAVPTVPAASTPAAVAKLATPAAEAARGGGPAAAAPIVPAPIVDVGKAPLADAFFDFYETHDGLRLLGNTLSPATVRDGMIVQYYEKGRLEDHRATESDPAWQLMYGLLVDELLTRGASLPVGGDGSTLDYARLGALAGLERRLPPPEGFGGGVQVLEDGAVFVPFAADLSPAAGQVVPARFWAYVNQEDLFPGGWLHDVGLPVTGVVEAEVDKGVAGRRRIEVQAFQRTILTYDPLNPPGWEVERANVGTDYARAFPIQS